LVYRMLSYHIICYHFDCSLGRFDERVEESQKAEEIAERIAAGERVIVPAFWRHEMLNRLLVITPPSWWNGLR